MVFVLAASFYSVSLSEPVQRKCVLHACVSPGCFGLEACKAQCSRSPSLDPPKQFKLTRNDPFPSSGKFRHLTSGDKPALICWPSLVRKAKYLGQKRTEMPTCFRNRSYSEGFLVTLAKVSIQCLKWQFCWAEHLPQVYCPIPLEMLFTCEWDSAKYSPRSLVPEKRNREHGDPNLSSCATNVHCPVQWVWQSIAWTLQSRKPAHGVSKVTLWTLGFSYCLH